MKFRIALPLNRARPPRVPIQRKPSRSWAIVGSCDCGSPSASPITSKGSCAEAGPDGEASRKNVAARQQALLRTGSSPRRLLGSSGLPSSHAARDATGSPNCPPGPSRGPCGGRRSLSRAGSKLRSPHDRSRGAAPVRPAPPFPFGGPPGLCVHASAVPSAAERRRDRRALARPTWKRRSAASRVSSASTPVASARREEVAIRADETFPTASLVKVPILLGLLDRVERKEVSLTETPRLHEGPRLPG